MEMIPNWLLQRAYLTPQREALRFEGHSYTFAQINDEALQLAAQLSSVGVMPFERVALLSYSTKELVVLIYACMHLQLEMVMLNNRLSDEELQYQLVDCEARYVFVDDRLAARIASQQRVITFSQLQQQPPKAFTAVAQWSKAATMTIMYTSGTTGFPKGVRQTVGNHEASAMASAINLGIRPDDCWFCASPIFHISGFSTLTKSLVYGMTVDLYEKFDGQVAATAIATGAVTHISVVSVMLAKILEVMEQQQLVAYPTFVAVLAGGGPVPSDYLQRAQALQLPVSQTYGMTETSSQTATLSAAEAFAKIGSAGKPLFFNAIKIDGAQQPFDEGEICIKGPHVTPGYIGKFAQREATQHGWLYSGDIGYLDAEGYLFVVDRRADLIISGGENIYPAEIENMLHSHPQIHDVGVCGVDDDTWGQVPAAFIVANEEAVSVEELHAFCCEKMAKYKVPKYFYFVAALPRNGANKLLRRELKNHRGE